ncbi:cytochrome c oxidase subunit II [Azospirillum canadense]|uniref:cytochrome c oxidase subunit II n=1 Tax=Azospirillum canadense TaxID=403962 RepID=UPI0022277F75|nr:cytochrome c oxidase subunit II [Azospirillum canadense]MCW2236480.1 cytochrome c oxidase subunit 2 [Azospirillum canadense]
MKTQTLNAATLAALTSLCGFSGAGSAAEPHPWQLGLQEAATPVKHAMDSFHSLLTVIIFAIVLFVAALLILCVVRFSAKKNPVPSKTSHHTLLEVAWTVVPVIVLIVIAVPSFKLLYQAERTPEAEMTIKVTGRQWYWDYEYPDHGNITFSSYMIPESDLKPGQRRLLEVDNRVVLPVDTTVRVLVTGGDVIHSWAVPSFGVKKDAVPGRTNETWVKIEKEGTYYGQCSEICGVNHGFMPIAVEAVSKEKFAEWVAKAKVAYGTPEKRDVAQVPANGTVQ